MDRIYLKNEERALYALRMLYRSNGYLPFKMSKFEEYDLYVRNKDFLVSDSVITFNDTDGRLLALKPDVTLSIIKNTTYEQGVKNRVYYDENVYRVSGSTHRFKEILQTGLECIGDIDVYDIFETVYLAAESLYHISPDFVLDISHMGIYSGVLDKLSQDKMFRKEITSHIAGKNKHEAMALCEKYGIEAEGAKHLVGFIDLYGTPDAVMPELLKIAEFSDTGAAYDELKTVVELLSKTELYDRIRLDFSVVNNMKYYNGIVFRGFLEGIFEGVLSGGEYQTLMARMGKGGSGVGFALYLDLLSELDRKEKEFDVDVLILYSDKTEMKAVISKKNELIDNGCSVSVQRSIPKQLTYGRLIDMDKEALK